MSAPRPAPRDPVPVVRRLDPASVTAAWGSPDALARFTDRPTASDGREAELWYGAHRRHPSPVREGDTVVSAHLLAESERPALLVKLLAADAPLSIQVHPDDATARSGFGREEAAGIPMDAVGRRFVDPSGKPELVRAIGPMRVLCGLRPAAASRALLSRLVPDGADALLEALARGDAGLRDAFELLLRADRVTIALLLAAVVDGARAALAPSPDGRQIDPELERVASLALDLHARHPGDVGVLVALLLEDLDLGPGEALWVGPGTPHAYLSGLGLEVMPCSDNVLRAGLTVKPIDIDGFLEVLDVTAVGAARVGTIARRPDGSGWRRFIVPSDAFVVDEADLDGALHLERSGTDPAIVLCLDGRVTVEAQDRSSIVLGPGGGALVRPGRDTVTVRGAGSIVHATRISPGSAAPTSD